MFKNLIRTILFVCVFMTMISSCNNDDGIKMIASNEFTVIIASRKLPGLVQIDNGEIPQSVFAVKKDGSQDWEPIWNE